MTKYLPSGGPGPGWFVYADTGPYDSGVPVWDGAGYRFDWSGVSPDNGGSCGHIMGGAYDEALGDFAIYNIARPPAGGRVEFTVTTYDIGAREQISFQWICGDLQWQIQVGYVNTRQRMTSLNTTDTPGQYLYPYPWTGSCNYLIWFPNGTDHPARLDFDGGSITMPAGTGQFGRFDDIALNFISGTDTTKGPPGFPLPGPPDPKAAKAYVNGIYIESWDPYAQLPVDYTWAVAQPDHTWKEAHQNTATGYLDASDNVVFDWAPTDGARLGP